MADRTRLTRKPERGSGSDRARLDALLDEALVATVATVDEGMPWVVPVLFARDGDRVLIHGSTGAGALRHLAQGAPAAFSVTAIDGIVLAESTFESSANYRSAVLRGTFAVLASDEASRALDLLSNRILPGRTHEVRASLPKELAATLTLALPIEVGSWLYKERVGPPGEPDEDHAAWCGVVPLAVTAGSPQPAPWAVGPVPASVNALVAAYPAPALGDAVATSV